MNAERLLVHYENIADTPDAIARLRRFVLDLAVRGKLVPQDPNDEPASELLKRIAAEKDRMVEPREISKQKLLPPVSEAPFDLPPNWIWTRTRKITTDRGQKVPDAAFTYIDVTAIDNEVGIVADPKVLKANDAPSRARKIVHKGDVLYSCVRPYLLNIAVIESEFSPPPIASTAFAVLNGFGLVLPRFQWIVLRSPFMIQHVEQKMRGQAYPAISDTEFARLPFPLPPLAEQHRIVAKVDELMVLCDRLQAARAEREATRDRFTSASLARLNTPDPKALHDNARFALDSLPVLTARGDQIKQLRQALLDLAIRGKLVPQDANEQVGSDGGHARTKNAELPFQAPPGWRWCDFAQVAEFENGDRSKNYPNRTEYVEKGIPWINTGHIQPDGSLSIASMNYITRAKYETLGGGRIKPNDLVYCLRGATFGKTAFVEPFTEGAIASSLMIIRPGPSIDRRFTYYYLISPLGRSQLLRFDNGTAQPNLAAGDVKKYLIAVPPLGEQRRIVVKIDELVTVCDRLEASLTTADDTRRRLLDALLAEALTPAETRTGGGRITQANPIVGIMIC